MTDLTRRMLFWLPRALSILFIAFISLFALDVFGEQQSIWRTLAGLAIHLIPSFVLLIVLVVAWRWEWVGAALYAGAGALYVLTLLPRAQPPAAMKLLWSATIAGPAFVIAILFLVNWLRHDELRRITIP